MIKKKKLTSTQLYLFTLVFFILCFMFIFISPAIIGKSYPYKETVLNEYESLSNTTEIALVKKQYNPNKKIMRLDFAIRETSTSSSLPNIEYEVNSQYITDRKPLNSKIIRVNNNYVVVIIKEIPEGFNVLSTTLIPNYIHPELEETNDLEDKSFKVYVKETDKIKNPLLKIQTDGEYQDEYISFQQNLLKKDIEKKEKQISNKKLGIKELQRTVSELEGELEYQTESEKLKTNNVINSHQTDITQYEDEIELLQKEIGELEEKINLLEEKRNKL